MIGIRGCYVEGGGEDEDVRKEERGAGTGGERRRDDEVERSLTKVDKLKEYKQTRLLIRVDEWVCCVVVILSFSTLLYERSRKRALVCKVLVMLLNLKEWESE